MPILDTIKGLFVKSEPAELETKAIVGADGVGRTRPVMRDGNFTPVYDADSQAAQSSLVFYSILSAIQSTAKSISWNAYKVTGNDEDGVKATNSVLANLVYRPNSYETWAQFVIKYIGQRLTTGNVFIYVLEAGSASELHIMPSATEVIAGNSWLEPVSGYKVLQADGTTKTFALNEVIHIKNYNLNDNLRGISPVAVAALAINSLDLNMKQRIYQAAKGGPDIVFSTKNLSESLTEEQELALYQKLRTVRNYTYLSVPVDAQQIGLSVLDLDLLNSLQADAGLVADLLHYPAVLLSNSKSSTYNNVIEAEKALYNNCILPLLYDLKEGLNFRLGKTFGDSVYINYDTSTIEVLKPNQAALLAAAAGANFLTINEKRKLANFKALEKGGDGFLLSAADVYSAEIDEAHELPADTYAAGDASVEGE